MSARSRRTGVTLVEMLVTSAIFAIVAAQLAGVFVGVTRLLRRTYAETELSLAARELREKLLFHARPPAGTATARELTGGLLSAASNDVPWHVTAHFPVVRVLSGAAIGNGAADWTGPVSLGPVDAWNAVRRANDAHVGETSAAGAAKTWLFAGGVPLAFDASSWVDAAGSGAAFVDTSAWSANGKTLYSLLLKSSANGVTHEERLHVPVFGRRQKALRGGRRTFRDD